MNIHNTELHWKTVTSIIKKTIGSYFEVNETPIENRKQGYYEFYVNGDRNVFIHVFFRDDTISSFGYQNTTITGNTKKSDYGRISGEKNEIIEFLKYVFNVIRMKGENRHNIENELYHILSKRFN